MKNIFKKFNILNLEIPKAVFYLIILASVLNLFRVVIWEKVSFLFILWNLFLAVIPFVISLILFDFYKKEKIKKVFLFIGLFLWLLFIPNAPYLVTDLIHVGSTKSVPALYDAFLLFSSACLGMVLFCCSLFHVEEILKKLLPKKWSLVLIVLLIILISFGMYLGRFLRFNSWDVFINHYSLIKNVWKIFSYELASLSKVYLFTLMFSFFLFFNYKAWKSLIK